MDAYIIPKTIAYIILSLNGPTTLQFDEQIEFVQAGKAGEISVNISSNKKTVVLQALQPVTEQRNMVILTKNNSFNLNYRIRESGHHQFLKIHEGEEDSSFKIKLETSDYKILEGKKSYLAINKKDSPLVINGSLIEAKEYFSKGLPLYLSTPKGEQEIVK